MISLKKLLIALTLLLVGCQPDSDKPLVLAVASNMQFAIEPIIDRFEQLHHKKCEVILGSSGKFTTQILAGAPYDIFIAADMKYLRQLEQEGITKQKTKTYARGRLVLWMPGENTKPTIEQLATKKVQHIALANPKLAPYGRAAEEVLSQYRLSEKLKPKLVYGESIAQVNQFLLSGTAEAGFTSLAVVLSPQMARKGCWMLINDSLHSPITQGIVVLKPGKEAQQFYEFLFSEEAKRILGKFGYSVS